MKGSDYYGKGMSGQSVQMASASSSLSATPVMKPAMEAMEYAQAAPVPEISMSEISSNDLAPIETRPVQQAPEIRKPEMMATVPSREESITAKNIEEPSMMPQPQVQVTAMARPETKVTAAKGEAGTFVWPVNGGKVLSNFGPTPGGVYNDGINIAAREGDAIVAAAGGEVIYAGNELRGYGNMVLVKHPGNYVTAYAHTSRMLVRKGDHVAQGDQIALVGKTGSVDQAQLHFSLRKGKTPVNPMEYLGSNNFASR